MARGAPSPRTEWGNARGVVRTVASWSAAEERSKRVWGPAYATKPIIYVCIWRSYGAKSKTPHIQNTIDRIEACGYRFEA